MSNVFGFPTAPSEGGDFPSICKFDARSGRMFRIDRTETNGNFENVAVDITASFKAIFHFGTLEAGWMLFASGIAPDFDLVLIGNELPARPSPKHKNGVKLMITLSMGCGGDKRIREIAGTSKAFLSGVEAVYMLYLAEKDKHPSMLPVIVLEKTTPVKTVTGGSSSTNYHPTFKIIGWSPSGELGDVAAPPVQPAGGPPSTGSTHVEAPNAAETVSPDDFG
jgi:hypothetical protein